MLRVHRLRVKRRNFARRTACQTDLRQTEVQNLCVSALGNKQVRRFDVPVDNAFGVCCVQRVRNLDGQRQDQFGFHRSASNAVPQRHAIQELHGNERLPIVLADLVDRANVGVVQGGSGAGFPAEPFERLRVLSYVLRQKLQCDKAAKLGVLSLIDHTHAAATEFLDDAVVRDGLPDH